jgi:hypothetical protein
MSIKHGSQSTAAEVNESLETIIGSMMDQLHVALPGRVERVTSPQLIDATPTLLRVFLDEDGVTEVMVPYPVITDIPVHILRGGGAFISLPLAKGDPVMLIFAQRSLDAWLETDGKTIIDPHDSRRHHISDAFALAGMSTIKNPIPNSHATDMVVGLEDGSSELHVQPGGAVYWKYGTLKLGSASGSNPLAKGNEVQARLAAIEGKLTSLTAALIAAAGSLVPPGIGPFIADTSSVKSSKLFTDA